MIDSDRHGAPAMDMPHFIAKISHGRVETLGQAIAAFGHRLRAAAQAIDDGVFAFWQWNGTRLVVHNDRYGLYPLFWFRSADGGIGVSPSITTLVEQGAPAELDAEALAVFFRLGFFVGDDTPFAAIKAVPPNVVFEWEDGSLTCRGRYPKVPRPSRISRDDAIDRYIDLFAQAMAKRAPATENFAVPVSGGRDSRHILLELHRTEHRPALCVSALDNPPDANEDPRIATLLCDELGFDNVIIEQQLSLLAAQRRKNRETQFCASAHAWYLALADFLSSRFEDVYDGIAGDVWSQSSFLDPGLDAVFRTRDAKAIAVRVLEQQTSTYAGLSGVLNGQLNRAATLEIATNRLAREVERHFDMPNPIASFFFWNRTRRMIALAPYGLLKGIPRVHAPFLDHDLFDFMITLPAEMLMDRTFHTDAIARAYPAFAHISYANQKTARPADDTDIKRRFLNETARRLLLRRPSSLLNNVVPRAKLLAGFLSRNRISPSISPLVIYLDQIDAMVTSGADAKPAAGRP